VARILIGPNFGGGGLRECSEFVVLALRERGYNDNVINAFSETL